MSTYWTRAETGAIYRLRDGAWEYKLADGTWRGVEDISAQGWLELDRIDAVRAGEVSAAVATSAAWGEVIAEVRRAIFVCRAYPPR